MIPTSVFALEPSLSCEFASWQFSAFHAALRAHVPWMCPDVPRPKTCAVSKNTVNRLLTLELQ